MKIVINISDEAQAERFLLWAKNRGDILMGDNCDFKPADGMEAEEVKGRYVYVSSAYQHR